MKNFLRIFFTSLLFLTASLILYVNYNFFYSYPSHENIEGNNINNDVLSELRYLRVEMHEGAADKMQYLYPEGFIFTNVLYGLAWCETAQCVSRNSSLYEEARIEITFAYNAVNSVSGTSNFDKELDLPYGAFYTGWSTYLLGKKLSVENISERDTSEVNRFNAQCSAIAEIISGPRSPFPESYVNACWPADAVICVASLSLHDKIFPASFSLSIEDWIEKVKEHLDSSGLIPHSVKPVSSSVLENARGSSQSLMLCFLPEIDAIFADGQFRIYKDVFLQYHAGLAGIREFRKSERGRKDIDSGPVILHIGASATITGRRTMSVNAEPGISSDLSNTIEAFGFPVNRNGEKKYLFGKLPLADAFIVWVNTVNLSDHSVNKTSGKQNYVFHLYSLGILVSIILIFMFLWKIRIQSISFRKKITNI